MAVDPARVDLSDLVDGVVARAEPGEQLEVAVSRSANTSVRAYGREVESSTVATSFGVGIRVVRDGRQGFAHCGTFDVDVVEATLADARDNAAFAEVDPWAGLAEPDGVAPVDQDLWDRAVLETPAERKVAIALEAEALALDADPRIGGVRQASYGDTASEHAIASTAGIRSAGCSTTCWVSVEALANDGDQVMTGFGVDAGRNPGALDVAKAAAEASDRATRLLGARPARTQQLPVVVEPRLAATLFGIVGATLTGDVVAKGRSPFGDRMGQAIASPLLTLVDDPTDPASLGADTFDGEGLACRRNVLLAAGVLDRFLHDAHSARRAGTSSTGSAVRSARSLPSVGLQALSVLPGTGALDDLVSGLEAGLLVQSMTGLHSGVNRTSGDFSVGAEGLLIRGGELAEPVREVTLASTLQRMLANVAAVGRDVEYLPSGSACPPVIIADVSLSGR